MASRIALPCTLTATLALSAVSWLRAADLAPPKEYEGKPIAAIRYEPASQPVTAGDLARLLPFHTGEALHLSAVRQWIKSLYSTGNYTNVRIDVEPSAQGVTLVARTTARWFVGRYEVTGRTNRPPNEGQLANATGLELGAPYDSADFQEAVDGIRDLFERNGLYRATVEPQLRRDAAHQQVDLRFIVRAGKRGRLTLPVIVGNTRIPPAELAQAAGYKGWFSWKPATETNTQAGVRNIRSRYVKQDRLTAAVALEHREYLAAENRVRPTIRADGGPKVRIVAEGAKISRGDLKKYVPVYEAETLNRDILVRGVGNLRDYFQDKGYFDVQIDFDTRRMNPDLETVTYTIVPGVRHTLVKLSIKGNKYFDSDEIRNRMFLHAAGLLYLRHGRYSEGFARRDERAIEALYDSNGFRDAHANIKIIDDYKGKRGDVAAVVQIQEGPQYLVSKLEISGVPDADRAEILANMASVAGQPFSQTNVSIDRDYILLRYQSLGYPDSSFDFRATPGPDPHRMALRYIVTLGPRRFVRDVLVTGLGHTRRRLVDPNILLKPGDPLSWTEMGETQRRLYNLGIFDKVDMAIQNRDGNTEDKYVLYNLGEGHRYFTALGLGAEITRIGGSQTDLSSPVGQTGFAPRVSLQASRLNLWGLGHSLNFNGWYSTIDQRATLNYLVRNYQNVEGRNLSFTALYENTHDVLTFTARRVEGSAQFSNKLSKTTTLLLSYTWRNVQVDQNTLKINPLLIPLVSQPAHVAGFGATFLQDRRDNPADPHRGYYNTADFQIFDHAFGGNKNMLRVLLRNSYYKPITRSSTLASNTQFGWIRPFSVTPGVSDFDYVPIAERFFGGGSESDRGFPVEQAGPRDILTGFPLGGNALFFHQTEYRFPLIGPNITGVVFHDFGNIFADMGSFSFRVHQNSLTDFAYMVHAVGVGLRYKTPLGPVRVDLAYSINPPTFHGLNGTFDQLLFGTATPTIQSVSHFQFFISIGQAF
jgi:outer membrane protein insertion porin family